MTPQTGAPPGSSVHGILQARMPEWVAISFSTILHKLFQNTEEEKTFPNLNEASITPITKPGKNSPRRLQTNIPCEHRCKNPQQNISKLNQVIYWIGQKVFSGFSVTPSRKTQTDFFAKPIYKCYTTTKWSSSQNARLGQCVKSISVIYHINHLQKKKHKSITIYGQKVFENTQHPIMITLS